jgi:hypothetical protein
MLDPEQQKICRTSATAAREVREANTPSPKPGDPAGLTAAKMTEQQQKSLRALWEVYVGNFPPEVADMLRGRIGAGGTDRISFAWAGDGTSGRAYSYRIQGPTFIIEYINKTDPAAHIHCYLRSIKNDFGAVAGR